MRKNSHYSHVLHCHVYRYLGASGKLATTLPRGVSELV
jgi:hypothetical protein